MREREIFSKKQFGFFLFRDAFLTSVVSLSTRFFLFLTFDALSETSTYIPLGFLMKYLYNS